MDERLAIMTGGKSRGSNMVRLIEACQKGDIAAKAALVIVPKPDAPSILAANELRVPTISLDPLASDYAERLMQALSEHKITIICLAGFLRLLPLAVLNNYPGRVLNIHPALLPKFGGKGMYGHHVHEAVLAAGETVSGSTVHVVSERYDEGRIIAQMICRVEPDDTPASLAARVLKCEHALFPVAVQIVINNEQ